MAQPLSLHVRVRYVNDAPNSANVIAGGTPVRVRLSLGSGTSWSSTWKTPIARTCSKDQRAHFDEACDLAVTNPAVEHLKVTVLSNQDKTVLGEHITPWTLGEALLCDVLTGHYAVCRGIVVALEMVALGFGKARARQAAHPELLAGTASHPKLIGAAAAASLNVSDGSVAVTASGGFTSSVTALVSTVLGQFTPSKPNQYRTKSGMTYRENSEWHNWTQNVRCTPKRIYKPLTLAHLQEIVAKAKKEGIQEIRCSGQKHSFASLCAVGSNGYLVVIKKLKHLSIDRIRRQVTFGPGNSIGEVDDFLTDNGFAFPANALATTFRYGGLVSGGCHGTHREMRTISDEIVSMTIVLANGDVKVFADSSNKEQHLEFRAAIVNFGTLGLIYSFTMRCVPQFNYLANDYEMKSSVFLAPGKLEELVLNHDAVEAFYWTLTGHTENTEDDSIVVKTWTKTTKPVSPIWGWSSVHDASIKFMDVLSHAQSLKPILYNIPVLMPKTSRTVKIACESLHYQGGIENTKLCNFELGIPCGGTPEAPDYSIIREAAHYFNKAVVTLFGARGTLGGDLPVILLELRFTRNSRGLISNVSNNNLETGVEPENDIPWCYFDVIMFTSSSENIYADCRQLMRTIFPVLCAAPFNARPHFAKNWEEVSAAWGVEGSFDIFAYYQKTLPIPLFKKVHDKYDPKNLFLNPLLRELLGAPSPPGTDTYAAWVARSLALNPSPDANVTAKAKLFARGDDAQAQFEDT